jgi:hypothetical protein
MKILINEYMDWLGTVKISNLLNSLLHEVLGCAPTNEQQHLPTICNVDIQNIIAYDLHKQSHR